MNRCGWVDVFEGHTNVIFVNDIIVVPIHIIVIVHGVIIVCNIVIVYCIIIVGNVIIIGSIVVIYGVVIIGSIIVINPSPAGMPSQAEGNNYQAEVSGPLPDGLAPASRPAKDMMPPLATGEKSVQTFTAERLRMIGETSAIQELRKNIERVAGLDCPLIIRGETGTGKQLTARIIHDLSPRRQSRFMAVNCGCFRNDLLIEELFRPRNRMFTGDVQNKGTGPHTDEEGTLLLDQIEDLSPKMQLSMLKIIDSQKKSLQDGAYDFPLNVRLIAASSYDLSKLVEEGKFRDELYYRLNVLELFIPPLRDRKDDIPLLSGYFLDKFSREFKKTFHTIKNGF